MYSNDYAFIEMEKMNGGTLQDLLKNSKGAPLDEQTTASIMKDIFSGLCMIHENNYIHRDLKPENILIKEEVFYNE